MSVWGMRLELSLSEVIYNQFCLSEADNIGLLCKAHITVLLLGLSEPRKSWKTTMRKDKTVKVLQCVSAY
jgi:hypothetical protein